MPGSTVIKISPNPEVRLRDVGDGQQCAIVDDFLDDPQSMVSSVAEYAGEFVSQPLGHPSRGKDIAEPALEEIRRFVRWKLSKLFLFRRGGLMIKGFMSNVSLKPEELSAYHRMCHIDPQLSNYCCYAGVIYLFENPELGGTAFYRWRAKEVAVRAYELSKEGNAATLAYLQEHSEYYRQPPQYMTGSNDIAELLDVVPARFNRLVFYNGEIPHSGHITRPELLTDDPASGRLTLNMMVYVRPSDTAAAAA